MWLSLRYKMPVITAWSTPGAALLILSVPELGLSQAIGAYLVAGGIVLLLGITGVFDTFIKKILPGISAGLLAGVLLNFGLGVFTALPDNPWLVTLIWAALSSANRLRHVMRWPCPRFSGHTAGTGLWANQWIRHPLRTGHTRGPANAGTCCAESIVVQTTGQIAGLIHRICIATGCTLWRTCYQPIRSSSLYLYRLGIA